MIRILIVDDDRATSTLLRTLFEIEGYEGVVCPRPDEVLQTAERERPDLILMDVHLAEVDSIGILKTIRTWPALKETPVIMMSGLDVEDKCLKAGATAFVLKPFRPAELLAEIKRNVKTEK
ncbi:MAG TPA: response regulator [Anaerolineae bacterium]|nr:response regulator [Anaerolineae bacterium]